MKYFILYLLIINLLSFIMFFIDKRKAIKDKWRIKESTLHFVSFVGGVFGSIFAMYLFHHKTKKLPFIFVTALALIMDVAVLALIVKVVYFQ